MKLVAIDYSITSPCICLFEGKRWSLGNCSFHFLTPRTSLQQTFKHKSSFQATGHRAFEPDEDNFARYMKIATWAVGIVDQFNPDFIALEGYSMGSIAGRTFDIAENVAILKYQLYLRDRKLLIYPPTVIKKFATGKGNANKAMMCGQFATDNPQINISEILGLKATLGNPVTDIVDSYYIGKLLWTDSEQLI